MGFASSNLLTSRIVFKIDSVTLRLENSVLTWLRAFTHLSLLPLSTAAPSRTCVIHTSCAVAVVIVAFITALIVPSLLS